MTFRTVGLTAEGKRILKFDHDTGRRHSPIIDRIGEVYIVENKSVAAYLRQLQDMGEDSTHCGRWQQKEDGSLSKNRTISFLRVAHSGSADTVPSASLWGYG